MKWLLFIYCISFCFANKPIEIDYFNADYFQYQLGIDSIFESFSMPKKPKEFKQLIDLNITVLASVITDSNRKVKSIEFHRLKDFSVISKNDYNYWELFEKSIFEASKSWVFRDMVWITNDTTQYKIDLINSLNSSKSTNAYGIGKAYLIYFSYDVQSCFTFITNFQVITIPHGYKDN